MELIQKHSDQIIRILGILESTIEFKENPVRAIRKLLFSETYNALTTLEENRIDESTQRIISGIAKDIEERKKFNPKIVNLTQTDHSQQLNQELLEQIIRKCKDEPEEKKQVFISNIYRNILTENWKSSEEDNFYDPKWGHKIAQITQNMTYQQLILLKANIPYRIARYALYPSTSLASEIDRKPLLYVTRNIYEYEDYMRLFNKPFGIQRYTTHLSADLTVSLILSDYDSLKRLNLIEDDPILVGRHRKEAQKFYEFLNASFCCHATLSNFGFFAYALLFHEDDNSNIPSLEKDIEELRSIIIDTQAEAELKQKYYTIVTLGYQECDAGSSHDFQKTGAINPSYGREIVRCSICKKEGFINSRPIFTPK